MLFISRVSVWFLASACGLHISITLLISSVSIIDSSLSSIFPDSILLISRISFINAKRCLLDTLILYRQSAIFSGLFKYISAIAIIPIIAFIGVRISWLIFERKFDLAWLARLVASYASFNACLVASSFFFSSSIYWDTKSVWSGIPQLSTSTAIKLILAQPAFLLLSSILNMLLFFIRSLSVWRFVNFLTSLIKSSLTPKFNHILIVSCALPFFGIYSSR